MKRLIVTASLVLLNLSAWALPSIDAVQAEVGQGHYSQAESMMREVIAARPDSARAHYVDAEILAHQGQFAQAAEQTERARQLDPGLSFTQADKFKAFSALLAREQSATQTRAPARSAGLSADLGADSLRGAPPAVHHTAAGLPSWAWAVCALGLGLLARQIFGQRRSANLWTAPATGSGSASGSANTAVAATGFGAGPGACAPYATYGQPMPAAGLVAAPAIRGGSLLGTGVAVAGGVAAGMLAERVLEGHREPAWGTGLTSGGMALRPGLFDDRPADDRAAQALEQRQIDFGTGDSWGGDQAAGSDNLAGDSGGW